MLTKDTIKKLKAYGIDPVALAAAHTAETEVAFEVPELVTEAQLTERDTNTVAAARDGIFKEGKDAGLEIAGKAIAKKYGLADVTDFKDPAKIIASLDTTVAKGDTGLKEQIGLLQADKLKLEADIVQKETNYKAAQFDTDLITHFPTGRSGMNDKEFLALTKMNLEFAEVDGKPVVKRNGEVLRDKTTQAPIAVKDAVTSLFNEKKWVSDGSGGGGRGGDDNTGGGTGGIKTYSGAEKAWLKANPDGNLMSTEFQSHIQKLAKETTDFNMDA